MTPAEGYQVERSQFPSWSLGGIGRRLEATRNLELNVAEGGATGCAVNRERGWPSGGARRPNPQDKVVRGWSGADGEGGGADGGARRRGAAAQLIIEGTTSRRRRRRWGGWGEPVEVAVAPRSPDRRLWGLTSEW